MKASKMLFILIILCSCQFVFSQSNDDFIKMPENILNHRYQLINGNKKVSLKEYEDKVVVLVFLATWCKPCVDQAVALNDFYRQNKSNKLEIIGVGIDDDTGERKDFRTFARRNKIQYKLAYNAGQEVEYYTALSRFDGIPQAFVIHKGEIRKIFVGSGGMTTSSLKKFITETLEKTK